MKVSNNALNFLLAQYRAIFKRAYVKGLASAVMLTAALAAGQAQAATSVTDSSIANTLAKEDPITIGNGDTFTISGSADASWNADVTINSGAATAGTSNYINSSGASTTLTGNGTLTINITDAANVATHGLTIEGGGGNAAQNTTVTIGQIDVQHGLLKVADNQSGSVTVSATTINVGVAPSVEDEEAGVDTAATAERDASLTLAVANGSTYSGTLGGTDSTINI